LHFLQLFAKTLISRRRIPNRSWTSLGSCQSIPAIDSIPWALSFLASGLGWREVHDPADPKVRNWDPQSISVTLSHKPMLPVTPAQMTYSSRISPQKMSSRKSELGLIDLTCVPRVVSHIRKAQSLWTMLHLTVSPIPHRKLLLLLQLNSQLSGISPHPPSRT
jgi:hypothetical protein